MVKGTDEKLSVNNLNSYNTASKAGPVTGGANSVYKTVNLTLSNYISQNKSKIDYNNTYNIIESGNYNIKDLLEQRGTKCTCKSLIVTKLKPN